MLFITFCEYIILFTCLFMRDDWDLRSSALRLLMATLCFQHLEEKKSKA